MSRIRQTINSFSAPSTKTIRKRDLALCQECEANRRCKAYQEYIQPRLPWVKASENTLVNQQMKRIIPGEIAATCRLCRHYQGNSKCEAYPDKIPTEILLGYVSHIRPYKGDQGFQFEPAVVKAEKRRKKD